MKKVILSAIFSFQLYLIVFSQGISNLWMMGYDSFSGPPTGGINMNFTNGPPSITYVFRPMNFATTNANISDSSGNLLFYSNGVYIADASDSSMLNGTGLNPSTYTTQNYYFGLYLPQANLILKLPGDTTTYLLFHETKDNGINHSDNLFLTTVDIHLNSGLGGVVSKNVSVISDSLILGEITACRHGNGRDWWVIVHRINSDLFYNILVTPNGIDTILTQNIGTMRNVWFGQSVFSPDGTLFAHYNVNTDLDVYDFDRCDGILSNWRHASINDSANGGGIAFSSNSKVIYVSSTLFVYQFDATVSNISSSQTTVAIWDGYNSPSFPFASTFFLSQLAPDNKIYINCTNSTVDLHVINNPDSLGLACDLQQHSVHLPAFNAFTIPNHLNYFLGAWVGSPCDSLTGVKENVLHNNLNLRINPNPAKEKFYVNYSLPYGKNAVMRIYNTLGEEVMRKNLYYYFKYLELDAATLQNGVYLLTLEINGNVKATGKVVIAK